MPTDANTLEAQVNINKSNIKLHYVVTPLPHNPHFLWTIMINSPNSELLQEEFKILQIIHLVLQIQTMEQQILNFI